MIVRYINVHLLLLLLLLQIPGVKNKKGKVKN